MPPASETVSVHSPQHLTLLGTAQLELALPKVAAPSLLGRSSLPLPRRKITGVWVPVGKLGRSRALRVPPGTREVLSHFEEEDLGARVL